MRMIPILQRDINHCKLLIVQQGPACSPAQRPQASRQLPDVAAAAAQPAVELRPTALATPDHPAETMQTNVPFMYTYNLPVGFLLN